MENFLSLKLEPTLIESIAKINFKTPTPIQAKAIPIALEASVSDPAKTSDSTPSF